MCPCLTTGNTDVILIHAGSLKTFYSTRRLELTPLKGTKNWDFRVHNRVLLEPVADDHSPEALFCHEGPLSSNAITATRPVMHTRREFSPMVSVSRESCGLENVSPFS
jgi:hypothetical protein